MTRSISVVSDWMTRSISVASDWMTRSISVASDWMTRSISVASCLQIRAGTLDNLHVEGLDDLLGQCGLLLSDPRRDPGQPAQGRGRPVLLL